MSIATGVEQLIGNTPLMRLTRLEQKLGLQGQLLAKLEYFNPGGSIKDRAALQMLRAAEQAGLRAGDWLTAFNGVPARNSAVLNHLKDQCAVGETVALTVRRGDAVLSLTCLLGAMPADGGK